MWLMIVKIEKSFKVENDSKCKCPQISLLALLYFLLKQCQDAVPGAVPQSTAAKVVRCYGKVDAERENNNKSISKI